MSDATQILKAVEQGDAKAAEQLLPLVYEELRRLAAHKMSQERPGHTLQPTALVHDAWLRLVGDRASEFENRAHFFAVHYAHQRGVIHRDLKPSNVLLDPNDQPRVTDFGVAKLVRTGSTPSHSISEEVTNAVERVPTTDLTVTGQVIGTPAYMPPEQAAARHAELGPASDVYSLGAILYYLLTGRPPFAAETVHATLSQVLHSDPVSPRVLNPGVARDLETVCLKCLEKEPPRRYRSARELAEELGRFLRDEPIHARAATPLDRVFKWTKRRPAVAALMGLVILVSAAGFSGVLWQWRQAADARGIAVGKAAAATKARENAEYESYVSKIALAASQLDRGALARAAEELGRCPLPLRHWEWAWLKQQCDSGPRISEGHIGEVLDIRFFAERQHALIRSRHSARIWVFERDREGQLAATVVENRFTSFMRNPTEALLFDGAEFSVWSLVNGQSLRKFRLASGAGERIAHVCPTGERVFTTALNVYETGSGKLLSTLQNAGGPAQIKAVSANGRRALTVGRRLELWDTDTGRSVFGWPGDSNDCESAVFSPDARKLFTQNYSQGASTPRRSLADVWDADTGRLIASLRMRGGGTTESPLNALFAPDGRRLLTTRWISRAIAEVWDAETGRLLTTFEGHTNQIPNRIGAMAFSPDGRTVCTTAYGSMAKVWNPTTGRGTTTVDGQLSFTECIAKVWDATTGRESKTLTGHLGSIECVAFSPDGSHVAIGGMDKSVRLWDLRAGTRMLALSNAPPRVSWATFSPNGRQVVAFDRQIRPTSPVGIWDAHTGEKLGTLEPGDNTVNAAVSRDGSRLLTINRESGGSFGMRSVARLWQVPSLRLEHTMTGETFTISADATRMLGLERTPAAQQPAVRDRRRDGSYAAPSYTARLWETDGGTLLASVGPTNHLLVTIDGEHCCKLGVRAGTASLVGTWLPHPPAEKHPNDLAPLPGGVQTLAGTEFDVRGVVQLSGAFLRREDRAYPEKVVNIFTGRKCRRLHFLHAAGWAGTLQTNADGSKREALTVPFGTALGHYVVRFVNGDSHEVPIVHGRDVREWWHWPESVADPKELVVAWTGTNAANRASNTSIRLFKSTWPNPHPNLEIASIDFISAMSKPAPFLLAITAE